MGRENTTVISGILFAALWFMSGYEHTRLEFCFCFLGLLALSDSCI